MRHVRSGIPFTSFSSRTIIFCSNDGRGALAEPHAYNCLGKIAASAMDMHISNALMAGSVVEHHSHDDPVASEVETQPSSVETDMHVISISVLSSAAFSSLISSFA